ncbi:hypothetical protein V866_007007 [Kwoniella sp. B9012]
MADANDLYKDDLYGDLDLEDLDATQLEELVEPPELDPAPAAAGGSSSSVAQAQPSVPAVANQPSTGDYSGVPQQQQQGAFGNEANADQAALDRIRPSDMPDEGKMFIGGLNWETTDDGLKAYMAQFGEIEACTIMRDLTGRSRGFAFLTYKSSESVNKVLDKTHTLDGKQIDPKRAIPRAEHERTAKVFVGGLAPSVTGESLRTFLTQFGPVMDATVMFDKETTRSKGFAFATFADEESVQRAMDSSGIELEGKAIEIKRAQPRGAGTQPGKFTSGPSGGHNRYGGGNNNNQFNNGGGMNMGMGGMGMGMGGFNNNVGGGGFDPNAMAMMYQNMMKNNGMGSMMGGFDPSSMAMMYQNMMKSMSSANPGGAGGGGQGNVPAINPNMAMRNPMMGMGMGGMGMGGMGMGNMGMGMGMGGMGMNNMGGNRMMNQPQQQGGSIRPIPNAPRGPAAMRSGPSGGTTPQSGSGGTVNGAPTGPGAQRYSTQGSARAKPY